MMEFILGLIFFIISIYVYSVRKNNKCIVKIVEDFEVEYIKKLRDRLERTAKYSKVDENINFKDIYENHFKELFVKSSENTKLLNSFKKISYEFEKEKSPYLIRLLILLKHNGNHIYDDYPKDILFTGEEIYKITSAMDIYFIREILKYDFKYIGELINIIQKINTEYKIKKYLDNSSLCMTYVSIASLDNIQKEVSLVSSSFGYSIDKSIK